MTVGLHCRRFTLPFRHPQLPLLPDLPTEWLPFCPTFHRFFCPPSCRAFIPASLPSSSLLSHLPFLRDWCRIVVVCGVIMCVHTLTARARARAPVCPRRLVTSRWVSSSGNTHDVAGNKDEVLALLLLVLKWQKMGGTWQPVTQEGGLFSNYWLYQQTHNYFL